MTDSPAKRRKTSPTTSVPIHAPATPSRIPVPIARQDGAKTMPGRPSFASPTKASLSRHNPQLLRPSSSGTGSERPGSRGNNLQGVFAKALGETQTVPGRYIITGEDREASWSMSTTQENDLQVAETFQLFSQPVTDTTPKPRSTKPVGGGLSAKPRRLSRSPVKKPEKPPTMYSDADPAKDLPEDFNPFRKKGLRRSPVPGQTEEPVQQDFEQPDIDPFRKTGLTRSPVLSQPVDNVEPPLVPIEAPAYISTTPTEPVPLLNDLVEIPREELPSQQDDVRQPEEALSSLGPLKSSRAQGMAEIFPANRTEPELPPTPVQRGIPDPVVTTPSSGIHDTPSKRARRSKALSEKLKSSPLKPKSPAPQEPSKDIQPEPQTEPQKPEPVKRRKSARFLIPEDPHAAKKKDRDDLLNELQQLQADMELANQENERLRLRAESKKKGPVTTPNPDELLAMLTRATAPERAAEPKPKPKPTSIFKSIAAFLPFHPRRKPASMAISEKPLPSHLPIAIDDPLPYLQAFSTLTYTSTITLLRSEPSLSDSSSQAVQHPLLQKHLISASHPSGLFCTRFSMTVDTSTLCISSLDILRLDMNAEKELGTFIRARARDEGPLGKDVTVICWAMSRWIEVSIQRARFWCTVEHDFGTPEARIKSFQKKRKRKRQGVVEDEESMHNNDENENQTSKWTRRQLLPHIGRTGMELTNEEVELRIEWKISFDWTGEVASSIGSTARLPKSWQQADERSSLSKVPETFDRLLQEKGHLGAVSVMVGLLMPAS